MISGANLWRVLDGDLVFERRRDEDVDVELEQLFVGQRLAARETVHRLVLRRRRRRSLSMSRPFGL